MNGCAPAARKPCVTPRTCRLTDGKGRTVDFKNTLVIMTSNLGSQAIKDLHRDYGAMEKEVRKVLEVHFKPEFLNRIDEVIIFRPLAKSDILRIVGLQLDLLAKRLAERKIGLEATKEAQELGDAAAEAMGCLDHIRIDMRVDKSGQPRIIEVNGIPGLKPHKSWSPQIFTLYHGSPAGEDEDYRRLIGMIVEAAGRRYGLAAESALVFSRQDVIH